MPYLQSVMFQQDVVHTVCNLIKGIFLGIPILSNLATYKLLIIGLYEMKYIESSAKLIRGSILMFFIYMNYVSLC